MAAKYLMGFIGGHDKWLFSAYVIRNARREPGRPEPEYDADEATLKIHTAPTVPDTGHRHQCYN